MDESWLKWVSILDTNDYHLFSEYDMNSVEEQLEGENSVDPGELSWENHSYSYLTKESTTLLSNSSSLEEINTGFDMTSLKQDASPQKPKSCILSFEDSTLVPINPKKTCQIYDHGEHSKETQEKPHNRKPLKRGRSFSQTLDHILAERKRRENISRMFIALSALIPDLKKMDKASVLSNAIEYVKYLQQHVKDLEQENKKRKTESLGCFKINKTCDDKPIKKCPKVEARVSGKDVLIRVTCEKQKDIVLKLLAKLEAHNLCIVCSNVLPFGNSALSITSIAMVGAHHYYNDVFRRDQFHVP
ncbi:Transcription factor bHLH25 isoform B [Glycine soja]|uniref:Transcription factor bHLH25 n=1 Tax=Glycine soja TaxID=3848 RepID=A0A0B2PKR7_GLYSO|nr:Transcription factor bHLH25 [Glycine soja]RZC20060.1 Transcription factor bHLH25 isoform B [Glycine soja]